VRNTSAPEAGTQQSAGQLPAKREPKPVPANLSDFLLADKVSARRFVQVLVKRTPLAGADLARSNEIIREQPTRIGRVVELTRAAAQTVPKPTILLRWCEEVLRSQDEALREWARDPSQDAGAALSQLMAWAYPRIQSKGKHAARHRAEVCLLIGLNLLFAWRSLSPLDALRSVASAAATRGDRRRGSSLDRGAVRLIVRAGVKQLLDFGRIVALSEAEIASAEEARRSAAGMVENLRREMEAVEAARDALNVKVEELGRELAKRGARLRTSGRSGGCENPLASGCEYPESSISAADRGGFGRTACRCVGRDRH
jgi:hypothetical protein